MLIPVLNDGLEFDRKGDMFYVFIPVNGRYAYKDEYILQRAELHFGIKFTSITKPTNIKFIKSNRYEKVPYENGINIPKVMLEPMPDWILRTQRLIKSQRIC